MSARFKSKDSVELTGVTCDKAVLAWAVMADNFDMQELCGQCERAMVMHWETFQDQSELIDQLSSGALQRIAKGLNAIVLAPAAHQWSSAAGNFQSKYNSLTLISQPAEYPMHKMSVS